MTKTRFEVNGWIKFSEEDSFTDGCLATGGTQAGGNERWHADTVAALLEQLRAFVPFNTTADNVELDACEDIGRIDICGTETNDNEEPTAAQIDSWKRGEFRLWYVVYTFHVERVTRETVSLTEAK